MISKFFHLVLLLGILLPTAMMCWGPYTNHEHAMVNYTINAYCTKYHHPIIRTPLYTAASLIFTHPTLAQQHLIKKKILQAIRKYTITQTTSHRLSCFIVEQALHNIFSQYIHRKITQQSSVPLISRRTLALLLILCSIYYCAHKATEATRHLNEQFDQYKHFIMQIISQDLSKIIVCIDGLHKFIARLFDAVIMQGYESGLSRINISMQDCKSNIEAFMRSVDPKSADFLQLPGEKRPQ